MLSEFCQVFWTFAQIGLASFGGPAASIALMQRAIVERRKWVTQTEFLDFVAVSHIIPGPIAVQLSLHLGYRRAGLLGAFVAVIGFVIPAAAITWAVAVFYQRTQGFTVLEVCLTGIRPAVLAIILVSLWQIARKLHWSVSRLALLGVIVILNLLGIPAFFVMALTVVFGSLYIAITSLQARQKKNPQQETRDNPGEEKPHDKLASFLIPSLLTFSQASPFMKSLYLFGMFFKIGLLLYGGGNVLAAYLQSDFVDRGLLTQAQFLDALAVGQSTPGPVLTVATFVGYVLAGHLGAILATLGIITPCIVFATLAHGFLVKARRSQAISVLLDTINLVVVGLILSVCINLGLWVFQNTTGIAVAVVVGCLILLLDVPPIVAIIGAAILGWWL